MGATGRDEVVGLGPPRSASARGVHARERVPPLASAGEDRMTPLTDTEFEALEALIHLAKIGELAVPNGRPDRPGVFAVKFEMDGDDWSPSGSLRLAWI